MPPHEELSNVPSAGPTSPTQEHLDSPGGGGHKGFARRAARPRSIPPGRPRRRAVAAAPGRLTVGIDRRTVDHDLRCGRDVESEGGPLASRRARKLTPERWIPSGSRGAAVAAEAGAGEKEKENSRRRSLGCRWPSPCSRCLRRWEETFSSVGWLGKATIGIVRSATKSRAESLRYPREEVAWAPRLGAARRSLAGFHFARGLLI